MSISQSASILSSFSWVNRGQYINIHVALLRRGVTSKNLIKERSIWHSGVARGGGAGGGASAPRAPPGGGRQNPDKEFFKFIFDFGAPSHNHLTKLVTILYIQLLTE